MVRRFNVGAPELEGLILVPWIEGRAVELDDRRWEPGKAKLTIYEAPPLASDEIGLGRGWGTVTRSGEDVTAKLLATQSPGVAELKQRLLESVARGSLPLPAAVALSPQGRPSQRLAAAEQAVWELLHEGRADLRRGDQPIPREQWQAVLLDWSSWTGPGITVEPA